MSAAIVATLLLSGCAGSERAPTDVAPMRLSLSDAAVNVKAGPISAFTTVHVAGARDVSLAARTPPGISVQFSPALIPAGEGTSRVSISVSEVVAPGAYPVTILAARARGGIDTLTLTLNVAPAPAWGELAVAFRYCAEDAPIWMAVRDNNGVWNRVSPNSGSNIHEFRVPVSFQQVGIASVDTVGTGYHLRVMYVRPSELAGINEVLGVGECAAGSARGSVVTAGTPINATVALAHSLATINGSGSGAFTLTDVSAGSHDLIASRLDPLTSVPNRLIIRRGLAVTSGATIAPLDFESAEAFVPVQEQLTLLGLGADSAVVTTAFRGTGGRANGLIGRPATYASSVGTVRYSAIPLVQLNGNELQQLTVTATPVNSTTSSRSTTFFFRQPEAFTVEVAPTIPVPAVTRQAGGYARSRVTFGADARYNRFVTATFSQPSGSRITSLLVTPSVVGFMPPWDFSIPDLSTVPGWNDAWGLRLNTPIDWSVTAAGGENFRLGANFGPGGVLRTVTHSGVLPAP